MSHLSQVSYYPNMGLISGVPGLSHARELFAAVTTLGVWRAGWWLREPHSLRIENCQLHSLE
jgi:hypothetical protein